MKVRALEDLPPMAFLSDLCGREVATKASTDSVTFLSDLCGREVQWVAGNGAGYFLSDLCGREDAIDTATTTQAFSKRPMRS